MYQTTLSNIFLKHFFSTATMYSIKRIRTSDLNVQIETVERKEKKEAIKTFTSHLKHVANDIKLRKVKEIYLQQKQPW